eukprot:3491052-Rhodomonas_salina.2
MRCAVLRPAMVRRDVRYRHGPCAVRCAVLTWAMVLPGATGDVHLPRSAGRLLRVCYTMPGTGILSGRIILPARWAMPGTDIPFGRSILRACLAMPGTDIPFGRSILPAR